MRTPLLTLCALATLSLLPLTAQAQVARDTTLTFDSYNGTTIFAGDSLTDGATADLLRQGEGVTFTYAGFNPHDRTFVSDLETPTNALDTTNGAARVNFLTSNFTTGINTFAFDVFGSFQTKGQAYGTNAAPVRFFNASGTELLLTPSETIDETSHSGLRYSYDFAALGLAGVQSIELPADAYFDNVRFTGVSAVPEASTMLLMCGGLAVLGGMGLRRRRRA